MAKWESLGREKGHLIGTCAPPLRARLATRLFVIARAPFFSILAYAAKAYRASLCNGIFCVAGRGEEGYYVEYCKILQREHMSWVKV